MTTHMIAVRLNKHLHQRVTRSAAKHGLSVSSYGRLLVLNALSSPVKLEYTTPASLRHLPNDRAYIVALHVSEPLWQQLCANAQACGLSVSVYTRLLMLYSLNHNVKLVKGDMK